MNINGTHYRTIWPDQNKPGVVNIIDQRQLPHAFVIEQLSTLDSAVNAIKDMHVRGAGLIGATAGFGMYIAAHNAPDNDFMGCMREAGEQLNNSRPTARNLKWAVDRVLTAIMPHATTEAKRAAAFETACTIAEEDASFCKKIGEHGKQLIKEISEKKGGKAVNILTHCNAGWLAFVDHGSATSPIYAARDAGTPLHVWVDETRPWNQGQNSQHGNCNKKASPIHLSPTMQVGI